MPIVGGLDIHRKQITFDYLDTVTGEVNRGQIAPADREHVRAWLARFAGRGDAAFAVEGCCGWRYVAEELAAAGIAAHLGEPADTAALRGRKRHAKTDKTDARHLRTLLAEGRLPECWIPPAQILEYRALLETCHDLRRAHTAWVQRIHAVFFHQGAPPLSEGALRTEPCHPRRMASAPDRPAYQPRLRPSSTYASWPGMNSSAARALSCRVVDLGMSARDERRRAAKGYRTSSVAQVPVLDRRSDRLGVDVGDRLPPQREPHRCRPVTS